jgi:hypothetical protein
MKNGSSTTSLPITSRALERPSSRLRRLSASNERLALLQGSHETVTQHTHVVSSGQKLKQRVLRRKSDRGERIVGCVNDSSTPDCLRNSCSFSHDGDRSIKECRAKPIVTQSLPRRRTRCSRELEMLTHTRLTSSVPHANNILQTFRNNM